MDENSVSRTWTIPWELAQRIKDLAGRYQVMDSDLVCALLTHALDDVQAGRWKPRRRVALYVIDGNGADSE